MAFSPDGKLLATADSTGYVRLWNPATRQAVGAPLLAAADGGLNGVAFSPDGTLLATADTTVRAAVEPGHRQAVGAPSSLPDGGVNGVAFSPDGKLLATAGGDGTVRLSDPATRQALGAPLLAVTGGGVNGVAFSPDGKLLASADGDGTVRLWNPATRQAPPRCPRGCHRRRERGGVQPGRQAAGQRRRRRHRADLGSGQPGRPVGVHPAEPARGAA